MKKELIITIIITVAVVGLVGFYGGRYYERRTMQKNTAQRQLDPENAERKPPAGIVPGMRPSRDGN